MKLSFNIMPKMLGFGGNCMGKTAQRTIKPSLAAGTTLAVNNSINADPEQPELPNVPLYQILPSQRMPININDTDSIFVTERTKRNIDYDYDENFSPKSEDESTDDAWYYQNSPQPYEEEDLDMFVNSDLYKLEEILDNLADNDILKKINLVDGIDISEEKKHDILMDMIVGADYALIDSIKINEEEKLKRKLDFIDEAYQDDATRNERRLEIIAAYQSANSKKK